MPILELDIEIKRSRLTILRIKAEIRKTVHKHPYSELNRKFFIIVFVFLLNSKIPSNVLNCGFSDCPGTLYIHLTNTEIKSQMLILKSS